MSLYYVCLRDQVFAGGLTFFKAYLSNATIHGWCEASKIRSNMRENAVCSWLGQWRWSTEAALFK